MTNQIHSTGLTDLEEFDRGWLEQMENTPLARLILGLTGLTRLGERPTTLERLAEVVDRPVVETAVLARGATTAHIEGNLIYWDEPFPGERTRRTLYVGDRAIPMKMGCAPDLFGFAAALDVPFRVEDTCAATGVPIRVSFVPDGVEWVDPPETVTVLQSLTRLRDAESGIFELVDTNVCAHQPFFASAEAAEPALAASPGSRAFTVREMFERPWFTYYRDNLRPLIHPADGVTTGPATGSTAGPTCQPQSNARCC